MGCGASVPNWQLTLTETWPRYKLTRSQLDAGEYSVDINAPDGGEKLLSLHVVPFKNKNGHVSVVSNNPFAVTFQGGDLRYDVDKQAKPTVRQLTSAVLGASGSYVRRVSVERRNGSSDTVWRAAPRSGDAETAAVANGVIALPTELSVVNIHERVVVWRGPRPPDASEAKSRASRDLLAQVLSTNRSTTSTDGMSREFSFAIKPELVTAASAHDGVFLLFLAIAIEGFWSQGSACHALLGDEFGRSAPSRSTDGSDVRPAKNLIDGLHKQANAFK